MKQIVNLIILQHQVLSMSYQNQVLLADTARMDKFGMEQMFDQQSGNEEGANSLQPSCLTHSNDHQNSKNMNLDSQDEGMANTLKNHQSLADGNRVMSTERYPFTSMVNDTQPWCTKKKKQKSKPNSKNSQYKSHASGSRINKARLSDPNGFRTLKGNADLKVLNNSEFESQYGQSGDTQTKKTAGHIRSVANTQRTNIEGLNETEKGMVNTSYNQNSPEGYDEARLAPGFQILVAPSGSNAASPRDDKEKAMQLEPAVEENMGSQNLDLNKKNSLHHTDQEKTGQLSLSMEYLQPAIKLKQMQALDMPINSDERQNEDGLTTPQLGNSYIKLNDGDQIMNIQNLIPDQGLIDLKKNLESTSKSKSDAQLNDSPMHMDSFQRQMEQMSRFQQHQLLLMQYQHYAWYLGYMKHIYRHYNQIGPVKDGRAAQAGQEPNSMSMNNRGPRSQTSRYSTPKPEKKEELEVTENGKIMAKALYPNLSPRFDSRRYNESKSFKNPYNTTNASPESRMQTIMNSEQQKETEKLKKSQGDLPDKSQDHIAPLNPQQYKSEPRMPLPTTSHDESNLDTAPAKEEFVRNFEQLQQQNVNMDSLQNSIQSLADVVVVPEGSQGLMDLNQVFGNQMVISRHDIQNLIHQRQPKSMRESFQSFAHKFPFKSKRNSEISIKEHDQEKLSFNQQQKRIVLEINLMNKQIHEYRQSIIEKIAQIEALAAEKNSPKKTPKDQKLMLGRSYIFKHTGSIFYQQKQKKLEVKAQRIYRDDKPFKLFFDGMKVDDNSNISQRSKEFSNLPLTMTPGQEVKIQDYTQNTNTPVNELIRLDKIKPYLDYESLRSSGGGQSSAQVRKRQTHNQLESSIKQLMDPRLNCMANDNSKIGGRSSLRTEANILKCKRRASCNQEREVTEHYEGPSQEPDDRSMTQLTAQNQLRGDTRQSSTQQDRSHHTGISQLTERFVKYAHTAQTVDTARGHSRHVKQKTQEYLMASNDDSNQDLITQEEPQTDKVDTLRSVSRGGVDKLGAGPLAQWTQSNPTSAKELGGIVENIQLNRKVVKAQKWSEDQSQMHYNGLKDGVTAGRSMSLANNNGTHYLPVASTPLPPQHNYGRIQTNALNLMKKRQEQYHTSDASAYAQSTPQYHIKTPGGVTIQAKSSRNYPNQPYLSKFKEVKPIESSRDRSSSAVRHKKFVSRALQSFYTAQEQDKERQSPRSLGKEEENYDFNQIQTGPDAVPRAARQIRPAYKMPTLVHKPARCSTTMTTGLQIAQIPQTVNHPHATNSDLYNLKEEVLSVSRNAKQSFNHEATSTQYRAFTNQDIQIRTLPFQHQSFRQTGIEGRRLLQMEKQNTDVQINELEQLPSLQLQRELRTGQQLERGPEKNLVKRNVTPQLNLRKQHPADVIERSSLQQQDSFGATNFQNSKTLAEQEHSQKNFLDSSFNKQNDNQKQLIECNIDPNLLNQGITPEMLKTTKLLSKHTKAAHPFGKMAMPNKKLLKSVIKNKSKYQSQISQPADEAVPPERFAGGKAPNVQLTQDDTRKHDDNKAGNSRTNSIDNKELVYYFKEVKESKQSVKSGDSGAVGTQVGENASASGVPNNKLLNEPLMTGTIKVEDIINPQESHKTVSKQKTSHSRQRQHNLNIQVNQSHASRGKQAGGDSREQIKSSVPSAAISPAKLNHVYPDREEASTNLAEGKPVDLVKIAHNNTTASLQAEFVKDSPEQQAPQSRNQAQDGTGKRWSTQDDDRSPKSDIKDNPAQSVEMSQLAIDAPFSPVSSQVVPEGHQIRSPRNTKTDMLHSNIDYSPQNSQASSVHGPANCQVLRIHATSKQPSNILSPTTMNRGVAADIHSALSSLNHSVNTGGFRRDAGPSVGLTPLQNSNKNMDIMHQIKQIEQGFREYQQLHAAASAQRPEVDLNTDQDFDTSHHLPMIKCHTIQTQRGFGAQVGQAKLNQLKKLQHLKQLSQQSSPRRTAYNCAQPAGLQLNVHIGKDSLQEDQIARYGLPKAGASPTAMNQTWSCKPMKQFALKKQAAVLQRINLK